MSFADSESQNATFAKLEELILASQGIKSDSRLTNDCFTSRTDNTHCPVTAVGGISYLHGSRLFSCICLEITTAFVPCKTVSNFWNYVTRLVVSLAVDSYVVIYTCYS